MMSTMTAISVRRISSLLIGQRTEMVIRNIRVIKVSGKNCPYLSKCTGSKEHEKMITRHIWEEDLEISEDIRHTLGNKEIYMLRKETIERLFGTAKEQHGFRYTQYIWQGSDEYESRAHFCMHESEKAGKDFGYKGKAGQ